MPSNPNNFFESLLNKEGITAKKLFPLQLGQTPLSPTAAPLPPPSTNTPDFFTNLLAKENIRLKIPGQEPSDIGLIKSTFGKEPRGTTWARAILGSEDAERIFTDLSTKGQITPETSQKVSRKKKAFLSFAGGAGQTILEPAAFIADLVGSPDTAESIRRETKKISALTTFPEARKEFSLDDLLDPDFYATKGAAMLPATLMLIPAGMTGGAAGAGAAGRVATAFGLGERGAAAAKYIGSLIGAGATTAPLESLMEAGNSYEMTRGELLARGMDEKEARSRASKAAASVFKDNLALLIGSNGLEFGLAFGRIPLPLRKGFMRFVIEKAGKAAGAVAATGLQSAEELVQGYFQDVGQKWALGQRRDTDLSMSELVDRTLQMQPQQQEEAISGLLIGALFSGAGAVNRLAEKYADRKRISQNPQEAAKDLKDIFTAQGDKNNRVPPKEPIITPPPVPPTPPPAPSAALGTTPPAVAPPQPPAPAVPTEPSATELERLGDEIAQAVYERPFAELSPSEQDLIVKTYEKEKAKADAKKVSEAIAQRVAPKPEKVEKKAPPISPPPTTQAQPPTEPIPPTPAVAAPIRPMVTPEAVEPIAPAVTEPVPPEVPAEAVEQEKLVTQEEIKPIEPTAFTEVANVPTDRINTDVERFQNRLTPFSEKTAAAVAESYDPNKFDPIVVWNDPKNGKTYVLSGHSRLEGMKRRDAKTIPVRYFHGTEQEAINFATLQANRLGAPENLRETIRAYRTARDKNYTKKQMVETFDGDVNLLDALTHLDEKGDFINILNQPANAEFPYIKRFASWMGELRGRYSDKLTDRHEQQIFDWLYKSDKKNVDIQKSAFLNKISSQLDRFDFMPEQPLVLKAGEKPAVGTRARRDTAALERRLDELRRDREKARTAQEAQAIDKEIESLQKEISEIVRAQKDLFAESEAPAVEKAAPAEAQRATVETEITERPSLHPPTSTDLDKALLTFGSILDRMKGRPTAEQQAAVRRELEAEGTHPVIIDELVEPRRAPRPEEKDFPEEIGVGDAYDLLRQVETRQYATTRKGRLERAVDPPAELKQTVNRLANAGKAFGDAKVALQKAKEDIITEIEQRGGEVIVNTKTGAFTIKINAGKAKLRMEDLMQLRKLRAEAAEAGAYSLATVGRGFEIAVTPGNITLPEPLSGTFAAKAKEFIRRNEAAKETNEAIKNAKADARSALLDNYLAERAVGRAPSAFKGIASDGTAAEILVRRQRSAVEPDIGEYVEKIERFKEEVSARAEKGKPFISTRETGKATLKKAQQAGAVVETEEGAPPIAPPTRPTVAVPVISLELPEFGANNTIVTRKDLDDAFASLAKKFATNTGLDPSGLPELLKIGTFYVEGGIREFTAWSEKMIADLTAKVNATFAERVRPHLRTVFDEIKRRRPGLFKAPKAAPIAQTGLFGEEEAPAPANILQAAAQKAKEEKAEKPIKPVPKKPKAAKEPWEMTRDEYWKYLINDRVNKANKKTIEGNPEYLQNAKQSAENSHIREINKAISEGKPVPDEVLADYPDLAKKVEKPKAEKPIERFTRTNFQAALDRLEQIGNLRKGESKLVAAISDAFANKWAEWNDSTPEEFYSTAFYSFSTDTAADYAKKYGVNLQAAIDEFRKAELKGEPRYLGATGWVHGKAIVAIFENAKADTVLHELGHVIQNFLPEDQQRILREWASGGRVDMSEPWTKDEKEKFARAWERYLLAGEVPNSKLKPIFQRLKELLGELYKLMRRPGLFSIELTPEVKRILDGIFEKGTPTKNILQVAAKAIQEKPTESNRDKLINDIVDAAKRPLPRVVPITEIKGTNGKWYRPTGLPFGFVSTGESRIIGYAAQTSDGTTVGKVEKTAEEVTKKAQESIDSAADEFRAELQKMPDDRLQSQADYWLKQAQRKEEAAVAAKRISEKEKRERKPKPKKLGAILTGDSERDARLRELRLQKKNNKPMTASQEKSLEILEREAAANPAKWSIGDGVGWKVAGQINRGYRIKEIDADTKLALIRPVADTGLTITGGGLEGIGPEWVHVGHLIRDKKYDAPSVTRPAEKPAAIPPTNVIQQAARAATEQAAFSADINKTKYGDTLADGRKLVAKNIASRGGAQNMIKGNPNREIVEYKETNGATRYAVIERISTQVETPTTQVEAEPAEQLAVPTTAPETSEINKGFRALADSIKKRLERGVKFDNPALTALAEEAFGGTRAEGKYTPKDAYDALELAVNEFIADSPGLMTIDSEAALRTLRDLMRILPRQADRTLEQAQFQQFSTPPTQAFVAAKILNPQEGETVLEPSAGVGGLAVFAKIAGANVHTNEISPRRAELLRMQGYAVSEVDAEILNDVLPRDIRPTAILMNPPFSATGGRVTRNRTEYGAKHVESALARLENGGRLVAIVGQGMAMDRPTFTEWWKKIAKRYNVRANIGIPGDEYGKYGTTFDNQIIVIDKTGQTPGNNWAEQTNNIVKGDVANLEEAINVTKEIAADRKAVAPTIRPETGARPLAEGEGAVRPEPGAGLRPTPGRGGMAEPGRRPGEIRGTTRPAGPEESTPTVRAGEPGLKPTQVIERPGEPAAEPGVPVRGGRPEVIRLGAGEPIVAPGVTVPEESAELEKIETGAVREAEESGKFVKYKPAKLKGGIPHPANIVESASMAAVDPPDITYVVSLPADIIKEGKLSDLQLETPHYAGQQFEKIMPNGQRMGYFNGDGTGVGKGRQIAGIIVDRWNKGTKRILWVSASRDLVEDAKRDMNDLGVDIPINIINDYAPGTDIELPQGVIFSTYQSLIGKSKTGNKQTRQKQLENWLGNNSVIIFDEAHKAKNALAVGGMGEPSQTAQAVIDIQDNLPKACVAYVSATGATDVRNMAYMTRLGLWGPGTAFPEGFIQFLSEIGTGGVGAMEMVARDMKALGMYSSRSISFEGVDYREVIHGITPDQNRIYNIAAQAWQTVMQNIEAAIEATNGGARQKAYAMSAFWGAHQRFFKQIITAMKVPTAIKEVERAISENKSAVLSIIGTGESRTKDLINRANAEGSALEDLDFSPRETIANLINQSFPTQLFQDETDPDTGNTIKVPVVDDQGNPVHSQEALRLKEELLEKLSDLSLPENPLDQVVNYFGADKVAEMTGRKRRLIRNKKTGKVEYVKRAPDDVAMNKTNLYEMKQFQDSNKRIAIISDAAATGISLHASNRAKNKQRRVHITLELGWSADKQMQTFGRTHRTDQASAPEYVLLSTDAGGEKRFSSTIARRLASLGALTKGQRDATGGGDLAKYNFETDEGMSGVSQLYLSIMGGRGAFGLDKLDDPQQALRDMGILKKRGKDGEENIDKDDWSNVTRFLNRVLALDIERQNAIFDAFVGHFEDVVKNAKESGTFDDGVADIKGESIRLIGKPEVIHKDKNTGAETRHYTVEVDVKTTPVTFATAKDNIEKHRDGAFFRNNRSGNVFYGFQVSSKTDAATGQVKERFRLTNPKDADRYLNAGELNERYEKLTYPDAKKLWDAEYEQVPKIDTLEKHIIGGAILPIWQRLKTQDAHGLKVARVTTDDGKRIVGVLIPQENLGAVLRAIGISRTLREAPDIFNAVLYQGDTVPLIGGMTLKKSRVHGDDTIELTGADYYKFNELRRLGLINEQIDWKQRFFIPTDEKKGVEVLKSLLETYPAIEEKPPELEGEPSFDIAAPYADPFFSQLERTLEKKLPNSGTAEQFSQMIDGFQRKGEFKADELDWLGLKDWLKEQKGKITKQNVMDFVRENQIKIEEVQKGRALDRDIAKQEELERRYELRTGEPAFTGGVATDEFSKSQEGREWDRIAASIENEPKYSQYVLPGGENYRELLFTLPVKEDIGAENPNNYDITFDADENAWRILDKRDGAFVGYYSGRSELGAFNNYLTEVVRPSKKKEFISTHFDEPNILAHVRFNERTDADGKRVLFVEEIQSDWHQAGRKKGYSIGGRQLSELPDGYKIEHKENEWIVRTPETGLIVGNGSTKDDAISDALSFLNQRTKGNVPDAPFKTSWHELVMKRMLRWAAENNFERLAWTTGEQQAERYDLSKQVDEIAIDKTGENLYNLTVAKDGNIVLDEKRISPQRISDLIGKEMAERAITRADEADGKVVNLTGLDLKVGGEGMKGFYDKILPSFMNKYGKKWGAKVGATNIPSTGDYDMNKKPPMRKEITLPVHSLDITPAMRTSVLMEGQPLFDIGIPYEPTPERDLKDAIAEAVKRARQAEGDRTAKSTEQGQKKEAGFTPDDIAAIGHRVNEIIAGQKDLKSLSPDERHGLSKLLAALGTISKTQEEKAKLSFADRIAFNNAVKQLKTPEAKATIEKIRRAIKDEKEVEPTLLDKVAEWTAGMYIWRLGSVGKSISSNVAMNLLQYPEIKMAAWFNKGVAQRNKVPIQIRPQEAMQDFQAAWMGGHMKGAWREAMRFMKEETNVEQSEFFKRENIKARAISGTAGKVIRAGLNAQAAIDVFFRTIAMQGEIARQTFRKAMQKTEDRIEALKLAEEYRTNIKMVDALQKGGKEIPEELIEFEEILNTAKRHVLVETFQEELHGVFAALSSARRHALVRIFVPFFNTQMNILKQAFLRTPFAAAHPQFLELGKKAIQKRLTQEEAGELSERLAKMTTGTLAFGMMLLLLHWMGDDDEITGDWDIKKLPEKPLGWQANSVRIGNRYISYQGIEPFATMFRLIGNIRESKHLKDIDKLKKKGKTGEVIQKQFNAFIDGLAQVTLNNPLTSEIFDIMDTAKQGKADEFFVKMVAGMALPGISHDISKIVDITARRKETLTQKGLAQAGVPGYTLTLPPVVDVFGQDIVPQTRGERLLKTLTGFGVSAVKDDPARAEIRRIGLKMSVRSFTHKKVRLTPDESMRLNQMIGERFHKQVMALLKNPTYKAKSDETKKKIIVSVRTKLLNYYKKAIEREPAFRERMKAEKPETEGEPTQQTPSIFQFAQ